MSRTHFALLLGGASTVALTCLSATAPAQQTVPEVVVTAPKDDPATEVTTDSAPGGSQKGAGLGGRFTGYGVNLAAPALGSKAGTPLISTPQNIQVVTRQSLDDHKDISVRDGLVGYVSSVQPPSASSDSNNFYDGFTIRGFDNANIYRNDLRVWEITGIETQNLQSIEVLKGPSAMLYGRLEPGGIVNLVPKRPLDTPYTSIEQQIGSHGLARTLIDTTGPLTKDRTWLYRLNLDFTRDNSFTDFVSSKNFFIGPTITWKPADNFTLNLDAEFQKSTFVDNANGFPVIGNRPSSIPISTYVGVPAYTAANPNQQQRELLGYDWNWQITKDWSLTNRLAANWINYRQNESLTGAFDPATGVTQFNVWDARVGAQSLAANLDLKGRVETGPVVNNLLFGADYWYLKKNIDAYFGPNATVGPLNIFTPNYSSPTYVGLPYNSFYPLKESWAGVYAQDDIALFNERVHLVIGGRYDWASYGQGYSFNSSTEAWSPLDPNTGLGFTNSRDQAFSPRVGVVVLPLPWLSVYADYTKSIGATNGLPAPGNPPFGPETATQWEGGVKAELLDKRLTATLAAFDIRKSNIVSPIGGTPFSTPIGLAESKGVELDVNGRINDYWSLTASYAYTDARIVKGQGISNVTGAVISEDGNQLQSVPRNAGSLWIKYDADGVFKGLSLGGGVVAMGLRQGDNQNDYQLPGFTRVDAMAQYHFRPNAFPALKNVTAQINVVNLFDRRYFQSGSTYFNAFPGAPRTVIASLRAEF